VRCIDHILVARPAVREDDARTADEPLEGCGRRHVGTPFGNRSKLIEPHKSNG
jgi:hypothetical protein